MSSKTEFTRRVIDGDQSLPLLDSERLVFWHAQAYHFALLWHHVSFICSFGTHANDPNVLHRRHRGQYGL